MRAGFAAAAALLLAAAGSWAETPVPADDPQLLQKTDGLCLQAALVSGGIDKRAKDYCSCMAPVLARHMTPESRRLMLTDTAQYIRPAYDDPQALYDDAMRTCPPAPP